MQELCETYEAAGRTVVAVVGMEGGLAISSRVHPI